MNRRKVFCGLVLTFLVSACAFAVQSLLASPPNGAAVQTWHCDPLSIAFNITIKETYARGSVEEHEMLEELATPPQYSSGPITDYNSALPNSSDVLRFRRGERYNIPNPSLPEIGENSETLWDLPETHFQKNQMPFDTSDAVVVGEVTAGQAYLSNDKRNIYSEFKLRLQEIIKSSNAPYLRAGESIDIQRKGGAIRFPSGKVVIRAALTDSMPQVAKRYLLFLKYSQDTEDFGVLTGYQLEGNEVYRLDDLNYSESNHQKAIHPLRKEGVSEDRGFSIIMLPWRSIRRVRSTSLLRHSTIRCLWSVVLMRRAPLD